MDTEGDNGAPPFQKSLAALICFLVVLSFQISNKYIQNMKKKKGTKTAREIELQVEIKKLTREANSMSQPSTFAQAAKLRRTAAALEKELSAFQEVHRTEINTTYESYNKMILYSKVLTYCLLVIWFWKTPVAAISGHLVHPFGKLLSWKAGGRINHNVLVGIIPWLILCTRVSRFIGQFVK